MLSTLQHMHMEVVSVCVVLWCQFASIMQAAYDLLPVANAGMSAEVGKVSYTKALVQPLKD